MLSTQYRLRLEAICDKIVKHEEVSLEDMIWAEKLAKSNRLLLSFVRQEEKQKILICKMVTWMIF